MRKIRLAQPTTRRSEAHTKAIELIEEAARLYEGLKDEKLSVEARHEMQNDFDCLWAEARFLCRDFKPRSDPPTTASLG